MTTTVINVGGDEHRQPVSVPRARHRPAPEHVHPRRRQRHGQQRHRRVAVLLRHRQLRRNEDRDDSHGADVQSRAHPQLVPRRHQSDSRHRQLLLRNDSVQSDTSTPTCAAAARPRESHLRSYFDGGFDLGGPISGTGSGSGALPHQRSSASSPSRATPTARSRSTARFLWYPTAKVTGRSASRTTRRPSSHAAEEAVHSGLSALRPLETTVDSRTIRSRR